MKVLAALILAVSMMFANEAANTSNLYPLCGIVIEVNTATDTVAIEDFNGNVWELEGIDDWREGDVAAMIMNDNGTETIEDDAIVNVAYNGWTE